MHTDTVREKLTRLMNVLGPQPARQRTYPPDLTITKKEKATGANGTVLEVKDIFFRDSVFVKTDEWDVTFTFDKDLNKFAGESCSIKDMRAFKHREGALHTDGTKIKAKVDGKEYELGTEVVPNEFIAGFTVQKTKMTVNIAP